MFGILPLRDDKETLRMTFPVAHAPLPAVQHSKLEKSTYVRTYVQEERMKNAHYKTQGSPTKRRVTMLQPMLKAHGARRRMDEEFYDDRGSP